MSLILTKLDLLFETGRLVWDDANRLDAPRVRPGGQGVNVTRAARAGRLQRCLPGILWVMYNRKIFIKL